MNKQTLRFSLGFLLLFPGFLVSATPLKVYAGADVVRGTSIESTSFTGETFNNRNQSTPVQVVPGTNVTVEVNGKIIVTSLEVRQGLNAVASKIVRDSGCGSFIGTPDCIKTPKGTVVITLVQGTAATEALNKLQGSLSNAGVSPGLIIVLVNNLGGLLKDFSSATEAGTPVAELQPIQPVSDTQLAQINLATVDVNQLNAAIKAYNKIVQKSNLTTLRKLSKNSEFLEVGQILKELRTTLKVSQ